MGYPDNMGFMVAGYTVAAVLLLGYWVLLLRRTGKVK
jgi:hypothetical protein